ncbi:hypothetical protein KDL01_09235 [Actinospica durhamensis]|uniref:Uncharacterized protein n=1 Tax=Actinospica durhamensis TaxID=1508375 RepID=A0A941EN63_9ACTN|nr:hypothetical protein [Actinospica durhamensis]MBR7833448.1 hypothetical protein [Actinospica durhamensis]
MTLTAKGLRSVTVDGVRYRWRMGRGWPSAFAVDLPGRAGSVLLATIPGGPQTDWCRDGVGLVVTRAVVPVVIRIALDGGWKPAARGPAFHVEVPFSELPGSVTTVSSHLDWCCEYRFIARLQVNESASD